MDPFVLPDDLTALTADEANTLLAAALAEYQTFDGIADADLTTEQLERIEYLADSVDAIRTHVATVASTDTADQAARAQTARERLAAAAEPVEDAEGQDPAGDDADPADGEPLPDDVVIPDDASSLEPEVITAAGTRRPSARQIAARGSARTPAVKPRVLRKATIVAGADIPMTPMGSHLATMSDVATSFQSRIGGFPKGKIGKSVSNRFGVAQIKKLAPDELQLVAGAQNDNMDKITAAAKGFTMEGDALVAAGGWCSPSETVRNLITLETISGILQLPEVTMPYGGVSFTRGPAFSDIYTDSGFLQTETEAEAGTLKNFIDVECPPFSEVRLDAIGFGIRAGILTNATWPQLIQRYIEGVAVAHAHKVNAYKIGKISTAAGAAINATELGSMLVDALSQLEMQAMRLRYKYRLNENESIEGFAPIWALGVFRQDIAYQEGVDVKAVTLQQINAWLAARNIRLQWVYDYQDLAETGVVWPATLDIILYPRGTFVVGTTDVISLDAVYDTASLEVNTYTAAFFEEGVTVFSPSGNAVKVQLTLASSGVHGRSGADDITNLVAP